MAIVRRGERPPPLARPWKDPHRVPFEYLAAQIADRAAQEATKPKAYAPIVRAGLDLLVYANRLDYLMLPPAGRFDFALLARHGWRSISFLHANYGCVLYANMSTPAFLQEALGECCARDPVVWANEQ